LLDDAWIFITIYYETLSNNLRARDITLSLRPYPCSYPHPHPHPHRHSHPRPPFSPEFDRVASDSIPCTVSLCLDLVF